MGAAIAQESPLELCVKLSSILICESERGDEMAGLDLSGTLKTLQLERAQIHKELTKLDRAIAVIRELAGTEAAPNGRPKKHTMSAAARRNIAKAQKLGWAKVRAERKAKA